jgi:hypothetical protein
MRVERAPRVSLHPSSWCWPGGGTPSRGPCNVVPPVQLRFGGDAGQLLISVS